MERRNAEHGRDRKRQPHRWLTERSTRLERHREIAAIYARFCQTFFRLAHIPILAQPIRPSPPFLAVDVLTMIKMFLTVTVSFELPSQ
jgi:hypothetical protein